MAASPADPIASAHAPTSQATCSGCRVPLPNTHRFCSQCGAPVDPRGVAWTARQPPMALAGGPGVDAFGPGRAGHGLLPEKKQVSVLFADLCDSTARVSGTDPEEARTYLDQALQRMTEAVETFGGTVSQLLGDGLLALFGAPVAQEDHALRACLAAAAMQAGRAGDPEIALDPLRIGIHSGEVFVGVAGQYLWSHYRADGMTIHLAARLEKLAAPGRVLISPATRRFVADQIGTRSVGLREVRGIESPMEMYELVLDTEGSAAAPLTRRRQCAPMVGRQDLLDALDALALTARGGQLRVVGLRGEAGVGKSRLLSEWVAGSAANGFVVRQAGVRSYSNGTAFSFAADLIRELADLPKRDRARAPRLRLADFDALKDSDPAHLAAINDLLELPDADPVWLTLSPNQRQQRIADSLHWLIGERLRDGPLLLVLEDIFLADRDSQRLLEWLVPRLENYPVLVCLSYRQDFAHRWGDEAWFVEHWIAPLREDHMDTLAQALLGRHDSLAPVRRELIERADGNPFFLEQLAIGLVDEASIVGTPGDYRLNKPRGDLRTPASIAAVIGARVDRLPPPAKAALEAASILGEPVLPGLLAAMLGSTPAQAEHLLRLGLVAGLLIEVPGTSGGFRFRHALVQEVVSGALTKQRRKALHRQALLALVPADGQGLGDLTPTLTRHAFHAEDWPSAATYAVKSMARAVSRSANREALRLFELGLDAAKRVADPNAALALELGLLLEAIGALMALGHIDAIFDNLERADAIATRLGDDRCRGAVSLQTAVFLWMRGRYTQGLVCAEQALRIGRATGRRKLQMSALQARMMMLHGLGRYEESIGEAARVAEDFQPELADTKFSAGWATAPIVNLCSFHCSALWRSGDDAAAQTVCDKAYSLLQQFDHPYSRGLVDFVQGQIWIEQGRFDEAERLMRASVESCRAHDVPTLLPCSVSMLGSALARSGRAGEAATLLEAAIRDRLYLAGGTYGEMFIRLNLGVAYRHLYRWRDAIDTGVAALDLAVRGEQHGHGVEARFELAETLRSAGQPDAARPHFRTALQDARRCGMPHYVDLCGRRLGEAASTADAFATAPAAP